MILLYYRGMSYTNVVQKLGVTHETR
jgi:hypothetical protein